MTHSLAHPPGPRSKFPGQVLYAFRSDPLAFFTRTAREYGDFSRFRIGRRYLYLLNDPDGIRDVLVAQAEHFTKGPALRQAKVSMGEGLLTSEGDFHKRQRRLSQPAFHPSRVASYADDMARYAGETGERWGDGQTLDVHDEMMRLTLRIVGKTLFNAELEGEVQRIGAAMAVLVAMFRRATSPFAPVLNRLPLPSNVRFLKALAVVRDRIDRFVREHRAAGVDRGDFLSMLLRVRDAEAADADEVAASGASGVSGSSGGHGRPGGSGDPGGGGNCGAEAAPPGATGGGMTDIQVRDEAFTLFTAGHETTANALTFTWYLLAKHPEVAERLRQEVDDVLGGRLPTVADVDKLPYVRMVLSESMRLYPPAWVQARQATRAVKIGPRGYALPTGGVVMMSQWVTHRDPRWWPDPEKFDPERWGPGAKSDRPRYAYFPFGGGPRSCIGEAFAWMEAILVIAAIAPRWRMELAEPETKPLPLAPTITLRPKFPLRMTLRRR